MPEMGATTSNKFYPLLKKKTLNVCDALRKAHCERNIARHFDFSYITNENEFSTVKMFVQMLHRHRKLRDHSNTKRRQYPFDDTAIVVLIMTTTTIRMMPMTIPAIDRPNDIFPYCRAVAGLVVLRLLAIMDRMKAARPRQQQQHQTVTQDNIMCITKLCGRSVCTITAPPGCTV
jgi:hypothetical protein